MFNLKRNTRNRTMQELDELAEEYVHLQNLSVSYEILHAELTCDALNWLAIDPTSEATQNYVARVSSKLDDIEFEWAAVEAEIVSTRETGRALELEAGF